MNLYWLGLTHKQVLGLSSLVDAEIDRARQMLGVKGVLDQAIAGELKPTEAPPAPAPKPEAAPAGTQAAPAVAENS